MNALHSPDERRRQTIEFDRNMRLNEMYYTTPPEDRPELLISLIKAAREGCVATKRALTNQVFLKTDPNLDRHKHWRGSGNYPTVPQEAHRLCKAIVGVGVKAVIEGPSERLSVLEFAPVNEKLKALSSAHRDPKSVFPTGWAEHLNGRSELSCRLYEAALASAGVSVVRTERRDAA